MSRATRQQGWGQFVSRAHTTAEVAETTNDQPVERSAPTEGRAIVAIDSLRPGPTPRRVTDVEHVQRLAETDAPLPPILVHRSTMRVIDGLHRVRAAILKGRDTIDVVFFDGSEEYAFIRAVSENVAHGLPLCLADRKAAAAQIISTQPHLSNRMIARYTGLAAKTVGTLRGRSTAESPQSNTREGLDGRARPLDATEGRRRAALVIAEEPGTSLREIAKTAGVSLGTAHDVRCRLRRGEDPIPPGRKADERKPPTEPYAVGEAVHVDIADDDEVPALLERLAKDPALRLTGPGRRILRLLFASSAIADWPELAESVPPHRAEAILRIAQQCAKDWDQLAQSLRRQAHSVPSTSLGQANT